jgi:histidinol-phosphate aminotransferase
LSLVPKHIKALKPYVAGKSKREFKRKFKGINPIKLSSNENPLGSSPKSIQRVQSFINSCNRYPDSSGFKLREKLADRYNLNINNVIIGAGSEGIMSNIMRTFLHGSDKIISSMNSFIGFRVLADASGYETTWVPMRNYSYDLDAIADQINKKTKIIYLANPDNPTGTYFTKKEFDSFMKKVPNRVLIILDEAYYEYTEDLNDYPDSMLYRYDNIITLRTFSKAYGLAGFRVGYGFAHDDLISNLMKVKLPFEPSILAQEAALAALDDDEFLIKSIQLNFDQKYAMYDFFNSNGVNIIKSATNFITLFFADKNSNDNFCNSLLEHGVIVRNLKAFGLPNCTRVTIGTEEENEIFKQGFLKVIEKVVV